MIKRLQIRIIAVVLGTLLIVFGAVLLVLNVSVYRTSASRADDFMASVAENDGFMFPPEAKPESPRGDRPAPHGNPEIMRFGRFFYAKVDSNGDIFELNLDMMFDFSGDDARGYISAALESKRVKGNIRNFDYLIAEKSYGRIAVFAERSMEISLLEQLTRISLWAAGVVSLVLACLAAFFAKWMVAPVRNAFDRQRRFISDASHELKTPLTIISANTEVLQNEIGENQRLSHIKAQSERMNSLVHDLLTLAKTDEGKAGLVRDKFRVSTAVLSTVLEFESRAFEEGKQYSYDLGDDALYVGDESQLKQLLRILIDNAIDYSNAGGRVHVSLYTASGHPCISVFNTGNGVPVDEYDKIFERFYRSDESRSRETGGYGIGLSIAKAISEAHRWKISVSGEYGKWIRFHVTL